MDTSCLPLAIVGTQYLPCHYRGLVGWVPTITCGIAPCIHHLVHKVTWTKREEHESERQWTLLTCNDHSTPSTHAYVGMGACKGDMFPIYSRWIEGYKNLNVMGPWLSSLCSSLCLVRMMCVNYLIAKCKSHLQNV
jgi:hypothetical protein